MEKYDFQYQPLRASEQKLAMSLAAGLVSDEEILGQIESYHESDARCAVVLIVESGEFTGGYVGGDEAISERFPFPQVLEALSTYEPGESVCIILQRDNLVSVGIIGVHIPPNFGLN